MKSIYDLFSSMGFYNALSSIGPAGAGVVPATAGVTLDMRGFNGVVFAVNVGSTRFAAASALHLAIQHGTASAAGVDQWSFVPNSLLIHDTAGGYDSTAETGIFVSLVSDGGNTLYYCGYKGDNTHRYVRLYVSGNAGTGSMCAGATAVMIPSIWPVATPVNT